MSLCKYLWQTNQDLAEACLNHPFVRGIAAGTLSHLQFSYYVGQDAFFLGAFARAYSIAAAKAPDWDGFQVFHSLANGVFEELKLHQSYARKWEVNLVSIQAEPATRRYTDFLLATAWGSDSGITAAAMVPCMRLYAFLGQELGKNGIPTHIYGDWIRTYSNAEFEELAQLLESLTDRYASATAIVQQTYRYAMLCERDFFQAAWDAEAVGNTDR